MFDHVVLKVANFERSLAFYTAALATLGYQALQMKGQPGFETKAAGFGLGRKLQFFIMEGQPVLGSAHVAFAADDHGKVRAFHDAAIGAGGRAHGEPGFRPQYHDNYYAAFILDPDGYNIEAVSHFPGSVEDQFKD